MANISQKIYQIFGHHCIYGDEVEVAYAELQKLIPKSAYQKYKTDEELYAAYIPMYLMSKKPSAPNLEDVFNSAIKKQKKKVSDVDILDMKTELSEMIEKFVKNFVNAKF